MIHLIGPGGAGKTTVGAVLAERLAVPFVDLDAEFTARNGGISKYLGTHGYDAYAAQNLTVYSTLVSSQDLSGVIALSSGFMTYGDDTHPRYIHWRRQISSSASTLVLLPSFDLETCVSELVRRQLGRPFARAPELEECVARERFPIYASLPVRKVETTKPVAAVVADLLCADKGRPRWRGQACSRCGCARMADVGDAGKRVRRFSALTLVRVQSQTWPTEGRPQRLNDRH